MHHVFVVSDGTGATAEQVLSAALTQFAGAEAKIEIYRRSKVRSEERVHQVVQEAAGARGLVVYTLVGPGLREAMLRASREHNVETIDLMGPLLSWLSDHLSTSPTATPGLFRELNEEYFRRIESIEFALNHDDGRRVHELPQAEIVLTGVSRTFKTPLSVYLAFKGWLVANVPLVLGASPPPALFHLPPGRVCGLTIDPRRLVALRRARDEYLGGATGDYVNPAVVSREVAYAENIFRSQQRWPVVDVTHKPIEEIASEVLTVLGDIRPSSPVSAQ